MATQTPNAREGQSTTALINYVQQKLIVWTFANLRSVKEKHQDSFANRPAFIQVRQLQIVLKSAGLPSSGVKKTLQERLIDRAYLAQTSLMSTRAESTIGILELSRNNEVEALEKLRGIIYKPESSLPPLPIPPVVGRSNDYGSSPTTNGEYPPYSPPPYSYSAAPQGCLFVLLNKSRG